MSADRAFKKRSSIAFFKLGSLETATSPTIGSSKLFCTTCSFDVLSIGDTRDDWFTVYFFQAEYETI